MKKLMYSFLVMLVIVPVALTLVACGDKPAIDDALVGKWEAVGATAQSTISAGIQIDFNANGTYLVTRAVGAGPNLSGNWTVVTKGEVKLTGDLDWTCVYEVAANGNSMKMVKNDVPNLLSLSTFTKKA